jgi:PIN domain nuclease of toxin-antitoxin system
VNEPAALLLDTCAAIWLAGEQPVTAETIEAIENARHDRQPIFVSPITAWEIGLLVARGRINMQMTPARWFARLIEAPGLQLAEMPPSVLIASSFLPGTIHGDPADRILAATAREFGYCLVTRDRPLLDYAEQGHIQALAC